MIQFTEQQPDHFIVGDGLCAACEILSAHERLAEWVKARGRVHSVQRWLSFYAAEAAAARSA